MNYIQANPQRIPYWLEECKAAVELGHAEDARSASVIVCRMTAEFYGVADVNAIPSLASMTQAIWASLSTSQKESIRDNSGLSIQLLGLEGWRVEVIRLDGSKKRFIVGKSTGWRPCHLEISRRSAFGGGPADKEYQSVKALYRER